MPIADYSTTADDNTSISGINVAEGCLPSNINNAIRQLMADLAAYREDVSADIAAAVSSAQTNFDKYFPSGCRMFFQQEVAPSGWKKITDYDNCALRLTSGKPGSRTNGKTFTDCFVAGRGTTSNSISMGVYETTLSLAQIPSHTHGLWELFVDAGGGGWDAWAVARYGGQNGSGNYYGDAVGWSGGNGSHGHGTWNNAHAHSIDFNVNYVDTILAERV